MLERWRTTCIEGVLISVATSIGMTSKRPKKTTTLLEIGNQNDRVRESRDALCKKDTGLTGGESAAFFWDAIRIMKRKSSR